MANYCGRVDGGKKLAGAVGFSGIYDGMLNSRFKYSTQIWQPYLVLPLKKRFLFGRHGEEQERRGVDLKLVRSPQVASLLDFDRDVVSVFNGYKNLEAYYNDLSLAHGGKWQKVAVPLLAVAARDDPVTFCDALHAEEFAKGNGHLTFLITDAGGHVGWPQGWLPQQHGWDFMHDTADAFITTVLAAPDPGGER